MTEQLPGLRVVVAWSDRRNLCSLIGETLERLAGPDEVRKLGDETYVVHTPMTTAALRDTLREHLAEGDHLFIADFEVWSSHSPAIDTTWLLRRGH